MSLCNQAQPKAHAKARGDRFARIPLWAAGVEIRPRAFRVLIAIAAHIDRDGWAYPSLASIAALTGIARNKLFAAVDQLENVGLLRRDRSKGGRSNPTRYQVVFKGPETDPRLGPIFADKTGPGLGAVFSKNRSQVGICFEHETDPNNGSKQVPVSGPQTEEESPSARIAGACEKWFMDFWNRYPPRDGDNPKEPARQAFETALKAGTDPAAIIRGVDAYTRSVANIDNRRFVKQAVTWLRGKGWEDGYPEPASVRKRVGIF